jgi:hypothetical protein
MACNGCALPLPFNSLVGFVRRLLENGFMGGQNILERQQTVVNVTTYVYVVGFMIYLHLQ